MKVVGEFKYAVVQFLEQPCSSIDGYICIPQSWIRVRRVTEHKSLVAYPSESPTVIEKRVKMAENVSEKWQLYLAIVKYETNSYEDANNYIVARRNDSTTESRCSRTIITGHELLPATTTEINSSSLKRIKQSNKHQKRLKVVDEAKLNNRSQSSECPKNELTSMASRPDVSSEKLIEIKEGKSSSTQKNSYQNGANNSSFCIPSSVNKSRCLPVNPNCKQLDLRATGLPGGAPSKVTESASVKNNTGHYTMNSFNQPVQSFTPLNQSELLQSHKDRLIKHPHLPRILEKPKETVNSPGISSQRLSGNTLHLASDPLILANRICQGSHPPQGYQLSSTYQDHLKRIKLSHEVHIRTISNLQSVLPDFPRNQKSSEGSRQSTPYTVQNTTNVANQLSRIPNSASVYKEHSQVLPTQEIPISQSSEVNCTNYIPTSNTSVSTSNSKGQSTFPTQYVNQPPVDISHSHQDPSVQEMIVDGSTELNCIEQSVSSKQCIENESSAIPKSHNQKRSPPVNKVTHDGSSTQDADDVNEQSSTKMNPEERLTSQIPFDQEGQSVDSITNTEDVWLDRMADIFDRINSDFSNTCKMAHDLHESLVQSAKTFQCIASASANLRQLKKRKAAVETPKEVTVEGKKVAEKEQVEMKEKENSDVDMAGNKKADDNQLKRCDDNDESSKDDKNTDEEKDGDKNKKTKNDENKDKDKDTNKDEDKEKDKYGDKDEEPPKKIRGCIRSFVLPPEYDPNNPKWTLKYRKPDSKLGIVELVEKSRVYINAIKLAHCKRASKDSKTLARMLLVEIFSRNALSVCSLTGARANAFDIDGKNVRPGLDEHARMVIMSFVEEHARLKGWGPFDTQGVVNSIRSKIQEIRAKYGQTT